MRNVEELLEEEDEEEVGSRSFSTLSLCQAPIYIIAQFFS